MPPHPAPRVALCLAFAAAAGAQSQPLFTFTDVSAQAGIVDSGISFGASAGDLNGDRWIDVFTGGHYTAHAKLWLNRGDGTFQNVAPNMVPPPNGDLHGAQWLDLDGDGSSELLASRGASFGLGSSAKLYYLLFGPQIVDVAYYVGLAVPTMRARTPLAVDYDFDGELDLFLTALRRPDGLTPTGLYVQDPALRRFTDASAQFGFNLDRDCEFAVAGDLDGDRNLDVLFDGAPMRAYALGGQPIQDITQSCGLPPIWDATDAVIADFDRDGENEVFVARDRVGSWAHLDEGERRVEMRLIIDRCEHGVVLQPAKMETATFAWGPHFAFVPSDVFIGAGGAHPNALQFTLDPQDVAAQGIAPHRPGIDAGIWIGWDSAGDEWVVLASWPSWTEVLLTVESQAPLDKPRAIGFTLDAVPPSDRFLVRHGGTYVDAAAAVGLAQPSHSQSAVAADFDNDMDLDLYIVATEPTRNMANALFENLGDGRFRPARMIGGSGSDKGVGDAVIAFDYDRDGRVDLFLVNGAASAFRNSGGPPVFGDDGPAQLLRNTTANANHWLTIELVGTVSHRDAFGARIEVTAGGRCQVLEQNGGMHRRAQNHGLHFGLGPNQTAQVEVYWPSGRVTTLLSVAADQHFVVVE